MATPQENGQHNVQISIELDDYESRSDVDDGTSLEESHGRPSNMAENLHDLQPNSLSTDSASLNDLQKVPKEWHEFIAPIISIIIGVGAIAFGACIIVCQNEEQSGYTTRVVETTRIISTLWPLLFAAALGDAVKTVARWLAERGATLRQIEHLMCSQTVVNSFVSTALLRFVHWQALLLIFIWGFSPIGSQALLRSLELHENFVVKQHTTPMHTVNPNFFADLIVANGSSIPHPPFMEFINPYVGASITSLEAGFQNMNGLMPNFERKVDALGASLQNYGSDLWGNVRIPRIERLPNYDPKRPHDWVDVPYQDNIVEYASLIGVPVVDLPQNIIGNLSWQMGANYHVFSCTPWEIFENSTRSASRNASREFPFLESNYADMYYYYNAKLPPSVGNTSSRPGGWSDVIKDIFDDKRHFILDTQKLDYDTESLKGVNGTAKGFFMAQHPADFPWKNNSFEFPERAMFIGIKDFMSNFAFTKCAVSIRYVDVNVTYERTSRGKSPMVVNSIRELPNPLASPNLNALQWPATAWQLSETFPILLQPNDGTILSMPPGLRYIMDPANFTTKLYLYQDERMTFSAYLDKNLTIDRFEDRFGLVFNTFWKAFAYTYSLTDLNAMYKKDFETHTDVNYTIIEVPIRYVSPRPATFRLNVIWIIFYMISSLVILVSGVIGIVLKAAVNGPDLLGFVGSLLRSSQHFHCQTPNVSSTIGGLKASRKYGEIRVRVGLHQAEPTKIALNREENTRRIEKGAKYL